MAEVKIDQHSLVGGISQEPLTKRDLSKAEDIVNCLPSYTMGLLKRPASEHIKDLGQAPAVCKYHTIYRSSEEKFLVCVKPNSITVIDLASGDSVGVTENATFETYLSGGFEDPSDIELLTVADTTFILNRNITGAMGSQTTSISSVQMDAGLFVSQGNPSSHYQVELVVDSIEYGPYETDTWNGATIGAGEIGSTQSQIIAEDLRSQINLDSNNVAASIKGSTIALRLTGSATGSTLQVLPSDSLGDTALIGFSETVPRVNGYLPEICEDSFIIKVIGDAEIEADDYYVKFVAENDSGATTFSKGYWQECAAPGIPIRFNPDTLPHALIGGLTGFSYEAIAWDDRTVGDESDSSNPNPSFIGRKIDDMFFYKDRLGFLSGPNVILSEVGEYYNFFRTTMLTLKDSDPIDVTSNHTKVTNFKSSVPLNGDLILFTDRSQFVFKGSQILSPRTVQLLPASEYEYQLGTRPVSTGVSVIFPFNKGQHTGFRELFRASSTETSELLQALDITLEIPDLISGTVKNLEITTLENMLVASSSDTAYQNTLWIYNYIWEGGKKIQSAWSKWTFGEGKIVYFSFIQNDLYIVLNRSGRHVVEKITVATGLEDVGASFKVHLDRRITEESAISSSYDSTGDTTRFTLPYRLENVDNATVVDRESLLEYQVTTATANTVTARGNLTGNLVYIGEPYNQSVSLSAPIVKLKSNDHYIGEFTPPQTVRYASIQLSNTRYSKATVDLVNRPSYEYEYNKLTVDVGTGSLDSISLGSDDFLIPIQGQADDITLTLENDSPYPSTYISANYLVQYRPRGRRQ